MFPVARPSEISYSGGMQITFPKHPELAEEVAAYLAATGCKPTTFGKRAVSDPSLIATLEAGRELRSGTIRRIRRYMLTGATKKAEGAA